MTEIALWHPQNGTRVRGSETFGCSAIAAPSMGHLGITGTLGVKEAGCGQRIGPPIGGTDQRDVTVELKPLGFQIDVSNVKSKTYSNAPGAKAQLPAYPNSQYVTQVHRHHETGAAIGDGSTWLAVGYIIWQ